MEKLVLVVHILTALGIIGLILVQQGKGADMGASFGSGGSQTVFGSGGGGSFFTRVTTVLAIVFFITSFALAVVAKQKVSVDVDVDVPVAAEALSDIPAVEEASDIPVVDAEAIVETAENADIPVAEETAIEGDVPLVEEKEAQ
ncbi:MAG: preprotein translocase subunit SecG [Cellvibrionaceae bacterium]